MTNEAGTTDSAVAVYLYEDQQDEDGGPGDYYVYRDGELIARTTEANYEDRTALGTHSYFVLNRLRNNNVSISNTVAVTVEVDCLTIGLLSGGAWQRLRLSERQNRDFRYARSRNVAYTHYSGAKFPETDVGEQEDLTGSFDAAWLHEEKAAADAFETLIGENVVVKTPHGVVIVGVLAGINRRDPHFYKSYEFEVRQEELRRPSYA